MAPIVGIDLGTTNSAISIIRDGQPMILSVGDGVATLPSVVGFTHDGELLVGTAARNQALVAPERTVASIKRKMGTEEKVSLNDREFTPQEISAMILRTLKEKAEALLGESISQAVITVPAYFKDNQRDATREAGALAGLEVLRIINEPTAAALTYQPDSTACETLLVYDLGGGTFDVSIVRVEGGVVEVLASHGDTHLGGDDFDALLLDHVCDLFQDKHQVDLRQLPVAKSRLLQSVEATKRELSTEAVASLAEEFIAERDGKSLHLELEIDRKGYEALIEPLVRKTIDCIDAALKDANLTDTDIDRLVLVGGSSRTPLVHRMLIDLLGHQPHLEIDPDLCVAMGAAIQGGLIAGIDVGPVLVDITPHTLGIRCVGSLNGYESENLFSPLIHRNTALPATRSEIYYTGFDGQEKVRIEVFQGENDDVRFNEPVGEFMVEGLDEEAASGSEIMVRFDLNLDGMLTATVIERGTGLERQLKIDNVISRFRGEDRAEARDNMADLFGREPVEGSFTHSDSAAQQSDAPVDPRLTEIGLLVEKARRAIPQATADDASDLNDLIEKIEAVTAEGDLNLAREIAEELEDILFYVEQA